MINRYVLSVPAPIVFLQFFVSYLNEKIKLEVLASSFEITSFEKIFFKDPKAAILTLKMLTVSRR
jgi:hypothetical protein